MPLGAFISGKELMNYLADKPVLGHITTFGGHPVCCAAGKAAFQVLQEENLTADIPVKEALLKRSLQHSSIKAVHVFGLWAAVEFESFETCKKIIDRCIEKGVLTDWFLFASNCLRISPPLTITEHQLEQACNIILESIEEI
jgi:acetylornithine/succinyldiaminopimelate/putrescine aminotransferase